MQREELARKEHLRKPVMQQGEVARWLLGEEGIEVGDKRLPEVAARDVVPILQLTGVRPDESGHYNLLAVWVTDSVEGWRVDDHLNKFLRPDGTTANYERYIIDFDSPTGSGTRITTQGPETIYGAPHFESIRRVFTGQDSYIGRPWRGGRNLNSRSPWQVGLVSKWNTRHRFISS